MADPDFIILGAAKCGTTSLCAYCSQHPEVFVSPLKEARFMAYDGQFPAYRGYGRLGSSIMERYDATLPATWNDYQSLFSDAGENQKTGEASPAYLYLEEAARNIKAYAPRSRLVVILRNPVERAFSSYLHLCRDDAEDLSFEQALDAESARISENAGLLWRYVDLGYYGRQLQRYRDLFPEEQLLILLHDDLIADQDESMEKIFKHIGVNPKFKPDTSTRFNVSGIPRNRALYQSFTKASVLHHAGRVLPSSLKTSIKNRVQSFLLRKPSLSGNLRQRLVDAFRDDIKALEMMIDRDLSHWLH